MNFVFDWSMVYSNWTSHGPKVQVLFYCKPFYERLYDGL